MGFWHELAKYGLDVGGTFVGDPMLGHQVMGVVDATNKPKAQKDGSILDTAGQVGDALGAAGKGRADARVLEAKVNNDYDRTAADLYRAQSDATNQRNRYNLDASTSQNNFGINRATLANNQAQTDLNRRNYALDAPGKRAGNAVRGDILANAQDVSVSGLAEGHSPVQFNGGLRPSMFSANTRALGANMSQQARSEQEAGDHFDALPSLPDYASAGEYIGGPAAPKQTPLPQSGKLDSILNTAGTVGNIADLMSSLPYLRGKAPMRTARTPPFVEPNDVDGWG